MMTELNHSDVKECDALHRVGVVVAIDTTHRTLDVKIGDITFEDVDVHYHCQDWWVNSSHPHSSSEKDQMLSAFSVDDQVLVLCDDDADPLYVVGFTSAPQSCSGMIILQKDGDVWYWDLVNNQGYHVDPGVANPTEPEIVKKWYTCEDLEVVEYYTRLTPVFGEVAVGGCTQSCGLADFDVGMCCDSPEGGDDYDDSWGVCPCDGEWNVYQGKCLETIECSGLGIEIFEEDRHLVGCGSSQSRTNVQETNCPLVVDYGLSLGDLEEEIEVGPRSLESGSETKSICTEESSVCGPYVRNKRCCGGWNGDQCTGIFDPYACGTECNGDQVCTGWALGPPGAVWRWTIYTHAGGPIESGCMYYEREEKTATYSTEDVPLITKVDVAGEVTEFEGWWQQYKSNDGSLDYTRGITGYDNDCQSCDQGELESDAYDHTSYSYSELSYGAGGWWTVVGSDNRFAVLIPELDLSASAQSNDGDVTGSISSTTTVILRIIDGGETEFEVADADKDYTLTSMPTGREDLLIKPNCSARELPLTVDLRAFHWYEVYDWILVAFEMDGEFEVALFRNEEDVWTKDQLSSFKTWVGANSLEEYTMFLH